jgi:hypothetical protein
VPNPITGILPQIISLAFILAFSINQSFNRDNLKGVILLKILSYKGGVN